MDINAKASAERYLGQASTGLCVGARLTLRDRLIEQKIAAESHLANLTQALEFLDKNPGFEEFHNIIGRAGF